MVLLNIFFFVNSGYSLIETLKEYKVNKFRVLLIANEDYVGDDFDLQYTISDVNAYALIFQNVFRVKRENIHRAINLKLEGFIKLIEKFKNFLKDDEIFVLIYAGHGDTNGMPIFVDKKTVSPKIYYSFLNSLKNDTILIMDSCYSGSENPFSPIIGKNTVGINFSDKDVIEKPGIKRSNILRLYSSLASQTSREGKYGESKLLSKYLSKTYAFLREIGYKGVGNGIFTIIFASFFGDLDFIENDYNFQDLINYINYKFSLLYQFGLNQKSKLIPWNNPFKKKKNYYVLYKSDLSRLDSNKKRKKESYQIHYDEGIKYENDKNYSKAVYYYFMANREKPNYRDLNYRLGQSYYKMALKNVQDSKNRNIDQAIEYANEAIYYIKNYFEAMNFLADIYIVEKKIDKALELYEKIYNRSIQSQNAHWIINGGVKFSNVLYRLDDSKWDKIISVLNNVIEVGKKNNDKIGALTAYMQLGEIYAKKKQIDKSFKNYNKAFEIAKMNKRKGFLITIYINMGILAFNAGEYKKSLFYFKNSLKEENKKKKRNIQNLIAIYSGMGSAYYRNIEKSSRTDLIKFLSDYDKILLLILDQDKKVYFRLLNYRYKFHFKLYKSREQKHKDFEFFLKKNYEKIDQQKDYFNRANFFYFWGLYFYKRGKYNNALEKYFSARKILKSIKEEKNELYKVVNIGIYNLYNNLSKLILAKKQYKAFINLSNGKMSKFYNNLKDPVILSRFYYNLAVSYYHLNMYEEAIPKINFSFLYNNQSNDNDIKMYQNILILYFKNVMKISEIEYKKGNLSQSLDYLVDLQNTLNKTKNLYPDQQFEVKKKIFFLKIEIGKYSDQDDIEEVLNTYILEYPIDKNFYFTNFFIYDLLNLLLKINKPKLFNFFYKKYELLFNIPFVSNNQKYNRLFQVNRINLNYSIGNYYATLLEHRNADVYYSRLIDIIKKKRIYASKFFSMFNKIYNEYKKAGLINKSIEVLKLRKELGIS